MIEAEEDFHTAVDRVVQDVDGAVVVVGSRGLGAIQSVAFGGFSGPVVHHSRRPVLLVPSGEDQ